MLFEGYEKMVSLNEISLRLMSGPSLLFAGGTDLMVKARERGWYEKKTFLDISELKELKEILETEDFVEIGAAVTLTELLESEAVQKSLPLLCQAVSRVGCRQIRNRATLAGNVANACPASDCIPALMVLDTIAVIQGVKGCREILLPELFRETRSCLRHEGMHVKTCFYGETMEKKLFLEGGEWIRSVRIRKQKTGERGLFYKLTRNRSSELAIVNIAAAVRQSVSGLQIRTSVGGVFPKPLLFPEFEAASEKKEEAPFGYTFMPKNVAKKEETKEKIRQYAAACAQLMEPLQNALVDYPYKKQVVKYFTEAVLLELLLGIPMEDREE